MPRTSIAIIGAGLAGLHAARLLRAAHVDFVLIEARDRLGGRILTVSDDGQPADDGFDLGPSWYWPGMQPAIAQLIEELGLPSFAQYSDGDVIFERMSREGPQRYHGDPQDPRSFRLAGGIGSLVRALARELSPERIRLGARVTTMTLIGDGVELAIQRAALGDDALIRACLDQFQRLFGAEARHPRATLLKDWAADPLTATAADRMATGHVVPDFAPWVSGPWQARLALAGSETSPIEPGYLAGAVVAAARAVDEVLLTVVAEG